MIRLMFRSFGAEPPGGLTGSGRALLWPAAFAFVAISAIIFVTLNVFAVFFGVTVSFLGRDGVRFRFLQLFRRVPLIALTMPVLFGYAAWRNLQLEGLVGTIAPPLLVTAVAIAMLAGVVLLNTLRDRSAGR